MRQTGYNAGTGSRSRAWLVLALVALGLVALAGWAARRGERDVAWRARVGGAVLLAPAVDATRAWLADESGQLTALSLADGAVVWRADLPRTPSAPPVVWSPHVAVGLDDGRVCAFRAADGRPAWSTPAHGSPVLGLAPVRDGLLALGEDGALRGLAADGAERFAHAVAARPTARPLATGDGLVILSADGRAQSCGPDGVQRWSTPLAATPLHWAALDGPWLRVVTPEPALVALDLATGQVVHRTALAAQASSAPVNTDGWLCLATGRRGLWGIAPSGDANWSRLAPDLLTTPLASTPGALAAVTADHTLCWWSVARGRLARRLRLPGEVTAPLTPIGGRLLVADWHGRVAAIAP